MNHFPRLLRVVLLAAPIALAACDMAPKADPNPMGSAGNVGFGATLSGVAEVPANTSAATGRLDAEDKARVERWLAKDAALARQLELIEDDRLEAVRSNEAERLPATLSVRSMATKIAPQEDEAVTSLLGHIRRLFTAPTVSAVRFAAAAARSAARRSETRRAKPNRGPSSGSDSKSAVIAASAATVACSTASSPSPMEASSAASQRARGSSGGVGFGRMVFVSPPPTEESPPRFRRRKTRAPRLSPNPRRGGGSSASFKGEKWRRAEGAFERFDRSMGEP